jgi:3,4-dihydroxy 2-butanone 4-phosphate synthase/GTP cyclohydrolase II
MQAPPAPDTIVALARCCMSFASVPEILAELTAGRPIILVDDPDRENEGDLCFPAQFATPALVNLMMREARGLVCLALDGRTCDQLGLTPQVAENSTKYGTAFMVSIDARHGITTGISAADRWATILAAVKEGAVPADLTRPGHVFPLRARDGGVLVRAGHTEGIVDLCRIAMLRPAGVICEILNDDGSLARLPQLAEFARRHGFKMAAIADLVEWRRRRERIIERVAATRMPTRFGHFEAYTYESKIDGRVHVALTVGIEPPPAEGGRFPPIEEPVLVRVHSQCLTGDTFGSLRCDCGEQLHTAMQTIQEAGKGILLYIGQEGRGIGLAHKMRAYALQDAGHDTVEANQLLGFKADEREFGTGAQILHDLGARRIKVLTNNPRKLTGLNGYGLEVVAQVPLEVDPNPHNEGYLRTKRDKLGHLLGKNP